MIRNSLKDVSWRDRKAVAADLKDIYQSISEEEARLNLKVFMGKWDDKARHWSCMDTPQGECHPFVCIF
jgi:transposase-like protein